MNSIKDPEQFLQEEYKRLVDHLSQLPHKILQHHSLETLSQMILHELGHDAGFGLNRAIYLVDNPDFDRLIGAAGFSRDECRHHGEDIWQSPDAFASDMEQANFHDEVKKIFHTSFSRQNINLADSNDVRKLGHQVGMSSPQTFAWNMKHGNHGILVFEHDQALTPQSQELLANSAAYLSLCSIF